MISELELVWVLITTKIDEPTPILPSRSVLIEEIISQDETALSPHSDPSSELIRKHQSVKLNEGRNPQLG